MLLFIFFGFVVIVVSVVATNYGIKCGYLGSGMVRTWRTAWLDLTLSTSALLAVPVLLVGIVALAREPEFLPHLLWALAIPGVLGVFYAPITGIFTFIGYNFGAQRRAQEEFLKSQRPARIMAEASRSALSPRPDR